MLVFFVIFGFLAIIFSMDKKRHLPHEKISLEQKQKNEERSRRLIEKYKDKVDY